MRSLDSKITDEGTQPVAGTQVQVLIVDDQKVVRDGLAMILGFLDGITVVGTAVDGADAVRQVSALRPDVVLMDLHMPVLNGVEATTLLSRDAPACRVVVLTTYADDEWVFSALRAGAKGFLTKDADAEDIRRAVLTVAGGDAQLDPTVQRRLLDALRRGDHAVPGTPGTTADGTSGPNATIAGALAGRPAGAPNAAFAGLTPREHEVLGLIAEGLSNAEIAGRLFVSDSTVKTHINHLLAKTSLRDRAQLVAYAFRNGLTTG
ncbi:response regulator transcription factor [Arthrobacter sp. H-02-3]|uniref:response regulator transcription factor n=1 Tax=Arthrobacter sp. H-02-3 TaxID=2703675 RepID=UPI000DD1D5CA|nr:response regulator transcription factor [Arthrobacter sp. H-02-3]PVZ53141.1 DNA-binding response regulator [Arthrobacter sp. H-02-3]